MCLAPIRITMTSTAVASVRARPSQNLAVPTTQNTAPVLAFKCLYTYDLRRKQKRWQDGLLRFHTFNKRIMVYDVPRNYIGDTHWRNDDIIGDGDEFELDRGVLIQVGEAAGSMEQDLTELLEKRNKPRDSVSGQATSSPMGDPLTTTMASPAVPQTSLLRPKSLNTLLGTPKGSIGRASIPMKSPHEMRKARDDIDCTVERPAKRPRLAEASAVVPAPVILQGRSSRGQTDLTPLVGELERVGRKDVTRHGKNGFPISGITARKPPSGQGLYAVAAPVAHETMSAVKPRGDHCDESTRKQRKCGEERTRQKVGAALPRIIHDQPRPTTIATTSSPPNSLAIWKEESTESIKIISDVETVSSSKPRNKRTKLQLASRKPRRKLMYRDLLPQDSPAISCSLSSTEFTAQGGRVTTIPLGFEPRLEEPLTKFHQKELDQSADRLNRRPSNEGAKKAGHKNKDPSKSMSPSLFFTQEVSDNPLMERHTTIDDLADTRNIQYAVDTSEVHPKPTRSARALNSRQRSIPTASSTIHDTELTLTKMDEILFSHPQSKPPLIRKPRETAGPVSPIRTRSPSPIPSPPRNSPPSRPLQNAAPPTESATSSPAPKTPSPAPHSHPKSSHHHFSLKTTVYPSQTSTPRKPTSQNPKPTLPTQAQAKRLRPLKHASTTTVRIIDKRLERGRRSETAKRECMGKRSVGPLRMREGWCGMYLRRIQTKRRASLIPKTSIRNNDICAWN